MQIGHFRSESARLLFMEVYDKAMKQLPKPAAIYDKPTSFGTVRVYRFGTRGGTPILLLPGRSSSTPMWEANLPGLLDQYDVYTIDLLGEPGKTVQSAPIKNIQQQAAWMETVLEQLNLEKVHLLGVSFGGWSVVNYAIHFPKRIVSLILLDPALVFARFSWKIIAFSLVTMIPFIPEVWRQKSLSWISGGAKVDPENNVSKLISIGLKDFVVRTPAPVYPSDQQLKSIQSPMLVLLAGKSIVHNSVTALARAKSLGSQVEAEVWPDASHAINGEFPKEINERIHLFLHNIKSL
jgi:pimeloyl-ACP methyl ester carboxylesterase